MRKIMTKEELEAKRKRNVQYLSIFMLAILALSSLGYAFFSSPGQDAPTPINTADRWTIEYQGKNYYLSASPQSSKAVPYESTKDITDYAGQTVYVASDNEAALAEIYQVLADHSYRVQEACYGDCDKDLPEKGCTENLIVIDSSKENRVYDEGKCVFIEGDIRASDAFIYNILGIE